jgi:prephenate dehydrogenase
VYYEIQARNPHSFGAIERLRSAIDTLTQAISLEDSRVFAELMREGQTRAHPAPTGAA